MVSTTVNAVSCTPWTSCAAGYTEDRPGNTTSDRTCKYFIWTAQVGSSGTDVAESVSVDGLGNVYVAGETTGAFSGYTNAGKEDVFLLKYDTAGTLAWTEQFGSSDTDYGYWVTVDCGGGAYIVGATCGAIPGATAVGNRDAYVRKYGSDRTVRWTRQYGTTALDGATSVAVDTSGYVYTTGFTDGKTYLRKFSSDGDQLWFDSFGTTPAGSDVWPSALVVDASGNLYVAGQSYGSLSGQPYLGSTDVFVRKHDAARVEQWTRMFGSSAADYGQSGAVDGNGNVYVTGWVQAALSGQPYAGNYDAFVRKYAADGTELWTREFGTAGPDHAESVCVDGNDNVYVTGEDFLRKYNGAGTLLWSHGLNGAYARSVFVANGQVFLAGSLLGEVFVARVVP